jgi:hypothetical protein
MRPGRATREKWRIPDGKVGERSVVVFGPLISEVVLSQAQMT